MNSKSVNHLQLIDVNDEWETPMSLVLQAIHDFEVYPKIDVCATKHNTKLNNFFDVKTNGLEMEWLENFFMNPPYSQIGKWMEKAYKDSLNNKVDGLILVYAKTDTKWWHKFVENKGEIHFIKSRIKFELNGIVPRYCKICKQTFIENINFCPNCSLFQPIRLSENSAPYPSCWIIFRGRK